MAIAGAAFLISPAGEVVCFTGTPMEVDIERIARTLCGRDAITSLHYDDRTCIYAAPVCLDWTLCVLSNVGFPPSVVMDRLKCAIIVLALWFSLTEVAAELHPRAGAEAQRTLLN